MARGGRSGGSDSSIIAISGDNGDNFLGERVLGLGAYINADDNVSSHRFQLLSREIADQTAIDEQHGIFLDRSKDGGYRHTGPHGFGQVAFAQLYRLPADDIRRHAMKGDGQRVKISDGINRHS